MKNIFAIIGSASQNSANLRLVEYIAELTKDVLRFEIFDNLKSLPHFDPELSIDNPPESISDFRESISKTDGVLICTPEYVFSIPSGLKNAIEWCVATTVFSDKPVGIITASASGEKGHEELKLIMKTLTANFSDETTLLVPGIKGKIKENGEISDIKTIDNLNNFITSFKQLIQNT